MDLNELRLKINSIDSKLLPLFIERMNVAAEVAEYKAQHSLPVLDKAREAQLLEKIASSVNDDMKEYALALYNTILDLSKTYQSSCLYNDSYISSMISEAQSKNLVTLPQNATVACQGVEGAYSQQACKKLFSEPNISFYGSFEEVFNAVNNCECEYGILPIENSIAGSVNKVYDLMKNHQFYIVKSVRLPISHCLLAKKGTKLEDIKEVYSHEQALYQCSQFTKNHGMATITCENTAIAATKVANSQRNDIAAICSSLCADIYGLEILESNIQNSNHNYTRFICISKEHEIYKDANQISLMMNIPHTPGSLYSVLSRFESLGLNLLKLESRPTPEKEFEFTFYFDVECKQGDNTLYNVCDELRTTFPEFVYLGTYSEVL